MAKPVKGDLAVARNMSSRSIQTTMLNIPVSLSDYQLDFTSPGDIYLTGSDPGQIVLLGEANDERYKAGHTYRFINASSTFVLINDFEGGLVLKLLPGRVIDITLVDNSTPEGQWMYNQATTRVTDIGSRLDPQLVVDAISLEGSNERTRVFLQGEFGQVIDPTLPDSDGVVLELWLFGCSSANVITLDNIPNVQLSGIWNGGNNSIIYLQWDNDSMWVEGYRNEL